MQIFRKEHPKPQFVRENWENLNGEWEFEIDNGRSGIERGLYKPGVSLSGKINVPFCPESKLSGIENTDFMYGVWYKRKVNVETLFPRTVIHFGAVDYKCVVWINGERAGEHSGGYSSFVFDITKLLKQGENVITVYAEDDTRSPLISCGKQSDRFFPYACWYTRTTGIWQTVWLEHTPESFIKSVKYYPNISDCSVTVEAKLCGTENFNCTVSYEGKTVGEHRTADVAGNMIFTIPLSEKHLWEVGKGRLYDVELSFGEDKVKSYFGLRELRLDGMKFLINGKSVFQRLILDQGFYPDGIYTAPSDEALVQDIELSLAAGFNGARLHEKIFEERYLYHADRLGYIVWGEYPDWGIGASEAISLHTVLPEWIEEIERDFNHPSIVGWCPCNEAWNSEKRDRLASHKQILCEVTKALDKTRPCIDVSGGFHVKTDIFDVHDYEQDPDVFKKNYDRLMTEGILHDRFSAHQTYCGEATFVSEYGGTAYNPEGEGWGYGESVKSEAEFIYRFKGLTDALLDNHKMFGLCYTQLTDVEPEQNGLYTYSRKPKVDINQIRKIMSRKAAIED
ncbi:MAG: beta-galactosidase [Ruminococcaceae bacterium]|nr:beta-galactosidase [Oscillospiraceae bacterium]